MTVTYGAPRLLVTIRVRVIPRSGRPEAGSQTRVVGRPAAEPLHAVEHPWQVQGLVELVPELLVATHHVRQDALGVAPRGVDAEFDVARGVLGAYARVEALARLPPDRHEVVAHGGELRLRPDGAVAGHDHLRVVRDERGCRLDPVADVALEGERGHVVEGDVAREQDPLPGQVRDGVPDRVRPEPRVPELDLAVTVVDDEVIL